MACQNEHVDAARTKRSRDSGSAMLASENDRSIGPWDVRFSDLAQVFLLGEQAWHVTDPDALFFL